MDERELLNAVFVLFIKIIIWKLTHLEFLFSFVSFKISWLLMKTEDNINAMILTR